MSPTITLLPTDTLIPTLTQIATPTELPTLEADQAQANMLDYLFNNGNCQLPCLWGITPGKTTSWEAEAILKPLKSNSFSNIWDSESGGGIISFEYYDQNSILNIDISYLSNDNIISGIQLISKEEEIYFCAEGEACTYDIYESDFFSKRIQPYTLAGVLSELGKPAGVLILTYSQEENRGYRVYGGFDILFLYPDEGVLVQYTTQMHVIGDVVRGCPTTTHLTMELFPAGHPESFEQNLIYTEWEGLWPIPEGDEYYWRRLEDVTNMSLEQFYETFREPTDKCIVTPTKYWEPANQ